MNSKHRRPRIGRGAQRRPIEELALKRGEEALAQRVVIAVSDRSHRGPYAGVATPLAEGERRILTSLIRVMDDGSRLPLLYGHVEGREHEGRAQMRLHRPADDTATPGIEHHGQVEESTPGRDVGDIGDPELIRAGGRERSLHQVGCRAPARLTPRKPAWRISRATRLRLTRVPVATSSAWMRGTPYVPREWA